MSCSFFFFFSSRRRHTRYWRDWSSDVCSSDLSHTGKYKITPGKPLPPALLAENPDDVYTGGANLRKQIENARRFGVPVVVRSEERRVGKECRSRWSPYH